MQPKTTILALGAACAVCCTVPLALPLVAGGLAGIAFAGLVAEAAAALAIAGVVALAAIVIWRRRRAARATSAQGCGCATASDDLRSLEQRRAAPIACTLGTGELAARLASIRDLAREALLDARRDGLTLHLTYARAAEPRVREMVAREQACCAFLRFDLKVDADDVHLTITAPDAARAAADDLFAHFAPGLSRAQPPGSSKELVSS